ncbi:hypothetical protein LTR05_002337 [Lithohypha guttulata]|uniref:BTB domain-containing protein n=1 Tax=Lithohypha guttulata TaxID=1690604 RepID=A0AAN7Y7Z7_9EURO|nr:hypothetical protein LTR05_002337 [Lithohypha guttulata]
MMDNETSTQAMERKEKPLNELLTESMVNIYVGSENTHWYIHERLLCYYSPFFSEIFYADDKNPEKRKAQRTKAYGLQDEDDLAFEMLVGWLYSRSIRVPKEEKDVGPLLDLYLLADKLRIGKLNTELVEAVSDFYYQSRTYPSLRRVQHIYANTDDDNEMREMMVGAVAKLLTTSDKIPAHWAAALQRNGQLAVDIIRSIQQWRLEEKTIPDARDRSSSRGRSAKNGFSAVERGGTDSMETEKTGGSNMGVESLNSDHDQDHSMNDSQLKSEDSEAHSSFTTPPPNYSTVSSPAPTISSSRHTTPKIEKRSPESNGAKEEMRYRYKPQRPPDDHSKISSPILTSPPTSGKIRSRKLSVTFADEVHYNLPVQDEEDISVADGKVHSTYTFFPSPLATSARPDFATAPAVDGLGIHSSPLVAASGPAKCDDEVARPILLASDADKQENKGAMKPETFMLAVLWMLYLGWRATI